MFYDSNHWSYGCKPVLEKSLQSYAQNVPRIHNTQKSNSLKIQEETDFYITATVISLCKLAEQLQNFAVVIKCAFTFFPPLSLN